jgi:hypothetical protein
LLSHFFGRPGVYMYIHRLAFLSSYRITRIAVWLLLNGTRRRRWAPAVLLFFFKGEDAMMMLAGWNAI